MSEEKEKKQSLLKNSFFLKLFLIPSICWTLLSLWGMDIPNDDGTFTTWPEFFEETIISIILWFTISFIIALIVNEIKKSKPKTKIVKEIQYITKYDNKIVDKVEEVKENKNQEAKKKKKKKSDGKYLYSCESITDGYEYKKMAKYFPKRMYWVFVNRGLILNLIFSALIAIVSKSLFNTLIFFTIYQIVIMILYKVRLEYYSEEVFNARKKKGLIDTNFVMEFYNDYFIRKGESITLKVKYSEISRCVENSTNFYLEYPKQNTIIIIQKNRCDLELINFIRKSFDNLENYIKNDSNFKGIKKYHHRNFIKCGMIILFVITAATLWIALYSVALVNKVIPQHGFNFTKNLWVFWCWLPIPILSIVLGFKYKKAGFKCTKNIVAGFIVGFYLLIYGSFCLFPTFSEDYNKINRYKEIIDAKIPSNGTLEIQEWGTYFDEDKTEYTIINAYYDKEDVKKLVESIETSENWILSKKIKSELKVFVPSRFKSNDDTYYSIYNKTTDQYNILPDISGDYEIYAMKYDKSDKHLEIHKFKISYIK